MFDNANRQLRVGEVIIEEWSGGLPYDAGITTGKNDIDGAL